MVDEKWVSQLVEKMMFPLLEPMAEKVGVKLPRDPNGDLFTIPLSSLPSESPPESEPQLCRSCAGMNMEALTSRTGYEHSEDIRTFLQSVRTCPLCDMIQRQMLWAIRFHAKEEHDDDPMKALGIFSVFMAKDDLFLHYPIPLVLKIDKGWHGKGMNRFIVAGTIVFSAKEGADAWAWYWGRNLLHDNDETSVQPVRPRGTEQEVLGRLSIWLKERIKEIPDWSDAGSEKPLPTRVIDLGEGPWDTENRASMESDVRLIETTGQDGYYVALSYCCGGAVRFRTLRSNYRDRLQNIRFKDLPKAYADAIKVTRGLGIRYLWIDALCIIQEDTEDFLREGARMSDIYWNTKCRIAVNDNKSPEAGFFPPKQAPVSVRLANLDSDEDGLKMYLTNMRSYAIEVDRGHLNTRGWVLQERLLAPRTIHFTGDYMYCEDQDDLCGEDWIRRYSTWLSSVHKTSDLTQIDIFSERNFSSSNNAVKNMKEQNVWWQRSVGYRRSESQIVLDPWLRVGEIFSRCQLTFDTDRLIAIAGLVKKKQELGQASDTDTEDEEPLPNRNFLGLWQNTLHIELCWVGTGDSKLQFLDALNLPSWAWIAHKGRIVFTRDRRVSRDPGPVRSPPSCEFELISSDVPDIVSALPLKEPASLKIRARLRKIPSISQTVTTYCTQEQTREGLAESSPFFFAEETGTIPIAIATLSECQEIFDDEDRLIGFVSFDGHTVFEEDLFCAHISTLNEDSGTPILAYALILTRLKNDDTAFRRVGLAELNHEWTTGGEDITMSLM
ncbi:heterokaryon incompatibility protein [Penicillium manginii]|jgi:hypothetical protein|uniref:heterokaryon incompatibility protein n=1 Tax=Penicillium manginii TaxID=203109 RepID=UPI00254732A6|nr:heterokaryon incompatibility protein [Penicillium manginii]KAJ5762977.1 heterokaryon incompatibility protein [Penicillium manginii]